MNRLADKKQQQQQQKPHEHGSGLNSYWLFSNCYTNYRLFWVPVFAHFYYCIRRCCGYSRFMPNAHFPILFANASLIPITNTFRFYAIQIQATVQFLRKIPPPSPQFSDGSRVGCSKPYVTAATTAPVITIAYTVRFIGSMLSGIVRVFVLVKPITAYEIIWH